MDGLTQAEFKSLTQSISNGQPVSMTFLAPLTMNVTPDKGWFKSNCFSCENGTSFQAEVGPDGKMYARDKKTGFSSRIIDVDAFRSAVGDSQDYDFGAPVIEAAFRADAPWADQGVRPMEQQNPGRPDGNFYAVKDDIGGDNPPIIKLVTRYRRVAEDAAQIMWEGLQEDGDTVTVVRVRPNVHGFLDEAQEVYRAAAGGGRQPAGREEIDGAFNDENYFINKYGLPGQIEYNLREPRPPMRVENNCNNIYAVLKVTGYFRRRRFNIIQCHFLSDNLEIAKKHAEDHPGSWVARICDGEVLIDGLENATIVWREGDGFLPEDRWAAATTEQSHPQSLGDVAGNAVDKIAKDPRTTKITNKIMDKGFALADKLADKALAKGLSMLARTSNPAALAVIRGEY